MREIQSLMGQGAYLLAVIKIVAHPRQKSNVKFHQSTDKDSMTSCHREAICCSNWKH